MTFEGFGRCATELPAIETRMACPPRSDVRALWHETVGGPRSQMFAALSKIIDQSGLREVVRGHPSELVPVHE